LTKSQFLEELRGRKYIRPI
jgi:hypothetical protein